MLTRDYILSSCVSRKLIKRNDIRVLCSKLPYSFPDYCHLFLSFSDINGKNNSLCFYSYLVKTSEIIISTKKVLVTCHFYMILIFKRKLY